MSTSLITLSSILLKLSFPNFTSPKESRFLSTFNSLNNTQKKNKKSFTIFPEKIISGEDKRTSIIIKNLPSDITVNKLEQILSIYGNINFCYIPFKQSNKKGFNTSKIAFINTINYRTVADIYMGLRKIKLDENNINGPNLVINYSTTQTKKGLIERFYLNKKNKNEEKKDFI